MAHPESAELLWRLAEDRQQAEHVSKVAVLQAAALLFNALKKSCRSRVGDYKIPETWTIGTEPLRRNINRELVKREWRGSLVAALC